MAPAADQSVKRKLATFDSSPFTLHEHCGQLAADVGACLRKFNIEDPADLERLTYHGAQRCIIAWDDYRRCGHEFMNVVTWAQSKCKAEAEAFKCCKANDPMAGCELEELAALRCAAHRIRLRMSGRSPPAMAE